MNSSNQKSTISGGPDPDIAGPGVMIGFIATGILATISSICASALRIMGNDEHRFWLSHPSWRARVFRNQQSSSHERKEEAAFWKLILETFVLNLSDQQLITGLLLVTLAYPKYFAKDLSNLGIAADLCVFSMITHFATILTIKSMLRDHFKLAIFRVILVFATMSLWLVISLTLFIGSLTRRGSGGITDPISVLAVVSSVLEMIGIPWGTSSTPADKEYAVEWLDKYHQDDTTPRGLWSYLSFDLRNPLSWLFAKFCQRYLAQKSRFEQRIMWIIAEIFFPFRFGNILQMVLLMIGIINLALDLDETGLTSSWGFGQLLPAFMLFLPFFSLAESYAKSKLELERKKEEEIVPGHDHASATRVPPPDPPSQNHDHPDGIEMDGLAAGRIRDAPKDFLDPVEGRSGTSELASSVESLLQHPRHRNAARNTTW